MKIVVLGAAAHMAQPALHYLNEQSIVNEIVLTDIYEARLRQIADQLGSKASTQPLNINDNEALASIMSADVHLVMNFIGPYYRFKTLALETAIKNGIHYLDLCDDYDVTMEALKLDGLAKENGVTAITGMGASPGITNVLARLGADVLDTVDEINTYWVVGDAEPSGFGALIHMFHIMQGKIPTFQDGEQKWIRAFQQDTARKVNFEGPVGEVTLYHVGHPEPITLPKYIPNVKHVTNLGALLPEYQNQMFKVLVDLGLTSEESIMFKGEPVTPLEFLLHLFHHKQTDAKKHKKKKQRSVSAARIEVIGEKNGQKASYTFTKSAYDQMDQGTSVPAGVVAEQILKGDINMKGVIPPEALDPKRIIASLHKVGYFEGEKGFQVKRSLHNQIDTGSIMDVNTFPELQ